LNPSWNAFKVTALLFPPFAITAAAKSLQLRVSADGETEHSVAYSLVRSVGIPAVLSHERHAVVAVHKSKFNSRSIHRPVVPILVGRFERYGKVEYLLVVILFEHAVTQLADACLRRGFKLRRKSSRAVSGEPGFVARFPVVDFCVFYVRK